MNIPSDVIETMVKRLCMQRAHADDLGGSAWVGDKQVWEDYRDDAMKDIADILSALADSGWVVVPKEPTKEMIVAAENAMEDFEDETIGSNADGDRYSYTYKIFGWERGIYQAMLAAALPTKDTSHDR